MRRKTRRALRSENGSKGIWNGVGASYLIIFLPILAYTGSCLALPVEMMVPNGFDALTITAVKYVAAQFN
jgi:hypothetical protein